MTQFLFANDAKSTLAAGIGPTDTTITLASGSGSLFPNPTTGQQFAVTLIDLSTGQVKEIVYCTARTGDVLTVARGQEGTPENAYIAGSFACMFITAGVAAAFAQGSISPPTGGPTASRPTLPALYSSYFDTSLGLPITCSQTAPTVVWVTASGVAV